MKLLGRDISTAKVLEHVEARLKARGIADQGPSPIDLSGVEARVDPAAFYLEAMAEHADATRGLPLDTHRAGLGRAVLLVKWGFRRTCQVLINEALGRQRLFNGHVRDAYAQLSADVLALKAQVEALRHPPSPPAPPPAGAAAGAPPPSEGALAGPKPPARKRAPAPRASPPRKKAQRRRRPER